MTVTRYLAHRLHQTSVSRFVRSSPLLNYFAERWWVRLHSRALLARIRGLKKPQAAARGEVASAAPIPSVPTLAEAIAKLPPFVTAGEEFSSEMAKYCRTSKFSSIVMLPEMTDAERFCSSDALNLGAGRLTWMVLPELCT